MSELLNYKLKNLRDHVPFSKAWRAWRRDVHGGLQNEASSTLKEGTWSSPPSNKGYSNIMRKHDSGHSRGKHQRRKIPCTGSTAHNQIHLSSTLWQPWTKTMSGLMGEEGTQWFSRKRCDRIELSSHPYWPRTVWLGTVMGPRKI
jgi:hypothetical protein